MYKKISKIKNSKLFVLIINFAKIHIINLIKQFLYQKKLYIYAGDNFMSLKFKSIESLASYFKTIYNSEKPKKFLAKQMNDIKIFGARHYRDGNVPAEMIEKYTPFRRLSKKPCTLSDNRYFIEKFERENGVELPKLWSKMSEEQKIDFIVKNRYEKLVSNKIMNDIYKSRIEESFGITTDGQIRHYGTFNSSRCCPSAEDKNLISIHNHPLQFGSEYPQAEYALINKGFHPFSSGDILNSIKRPKAYVVDMNANKYSLIPNKEIQNPYTVDEYVDNLSIDLINITLKNKHSYPKISEAIKNARLDYIKRLKEDCHTIQHLNLFDLK